MRVFKTCCIIVKRHIASFALYFIIFITLSVVMTAYSLDRYSVNFAEMKPNFTFINHDKPSALTNGLAAYLSERGVQIVLEDRKEALQDATFNKATDIIAIIPNGFRDAVMNGDDISIETVTTTESAKGYYADSLINKYLNLTRMYLSLNPAMDEAAVITAVAGDLSTESTVVKKRFGDSAPVNEGYRIYMGMLAYIIMVLITLCVSNITKAFKRPDIRMRNLCAPLRPRTFNNQQVLCGLMLSIAAWLLLIMVGFAIYGGGLADTDSTIILMIVLNSFVFMLVSLAIGTLASTFINSPNTQNAVANFLSLSICFLGGVFVPLDMLGEGLLGVSRFTPAYWYITALNHISSVNSFGADSMNPFWQALLIQLTFAAALFCVALVINTQQNQSERSFSTTQTELDA